MPSYGFELFKALLSLIPLAAGWFIGQRIISSWDLRKKRQELDIASSLEFQQLYGDLKAVSRLWRSTVRVRDDSIHMPVEARWTQLERATLAEGRYESVVMKLASERLLTSAQIRTLGLFRQACQAIRNSIREGEAPPSSNFGPEYLAFNDLAAEITCLLATSPPAVRSDSMRAKQSLAAIAAVGSKDWYAWVRQVGEEFVRGRGAEGQ